MPFPSLDFHLILRVVEGLDHVGGICARVGAALQGPVHCEACRSFVFRVAEEATSASWLSRSMSGLLTVAMSSAPSSGWASLKISIITYSDSIGAP